MSDVDHHALMEKFESVFSSQDWARLGEIIAEDAVWEYPQSGEVFRGLANIRGQLENYPDLEAGSTKLQEVLGGTEYALTSNYTVVAVQGSGDRGTSVVRAHYPDGSYWLVVNLYEVRDGKMVRARAFFAPEFEPPEWRAPFREPHG